MPRTLEQMIDRLGTVVHYLRDHPELAYLSGELRRVLGGATPGDNLTALLIGWMLQAELAIDDWLESLTQNVTCSPRFQQLEASWRGMEFLARNNPDPQRIQLRLLDASWDTLTRDQEQSLDFDQSELFRKVYSNEFGTPGGKPFGLLLADYEVQHGPTHDHPSRDVPVLKRLAQIAACAFSPIVIGASPGLLGLAAFREVGWGTDLEERFRHRQYSEWRGLRSMDESRYLGVTAPRVMWRLPYQDVVGSEPQAWTRSRPRAWIREKEGMLPASAGPKDTAPTPMPLGQQESLARQSQLQLGERQLWGTGVFVLGQLAMRSFAETGWLDDMKGVDADQPRGGLVERLPCGSFGTEQPGDAPRISTSLRVTDNLEPKMAKLGLIPICACKYTQLTAVYSLPALHAPENYTAFSGTVNEAVSSQLNLMLCVSRFAHYIKVITRDWIGGTTSAAELRSRLNRWITQYVSPSAESSESRFRYPLLSAALDVIQDRSDPGAFYCRARLQPHLHGAHVDAVTFVTALTRAPRRMMSA